MKKSICLVLTVVGVGVAFGTLAQRKPDAIIKDRQALMTMQNWALRDLSMMVKGQRPYDKGVVERSVAVLDGTNRMLPEAVPAGSGPDSGIPTRARAEIWSEPDKFKQAIGHFQAETTKLNEAARAGTLDALRASFSGVVKSCEGCHESFRAKR